VRVAAAIALFFAVGIAGVLTFVYSGLYDIGATTPHSPVTYWVLRKTMERSVMRQARNVKVPELDDPEKVHIGFRGYQEMCVTCHGAPGTPASQISKGLYPEAPDLAQAAKDWTPAELYVIIQRGVKMSGMPAWEPTHSGEDIWTLVAFLQVLPTMPVAEYQDAVAYYAARVKNKEMQAGHH
jgi:mono/diheme cytochrome c family protein